MGWYINLLKFIILLCLSVIFSSCAAKNNKECISSSLLLSADNKNIDILLKDNGCTYSFYKMPNNIWKIEIENGSFTQFIPKADINIKKLVPVIKKNNKEILLFFANNGNLMQKKAGYFTYLQDNSSYIPYRKAGYIEKIVCSDNKTVIEGNGALLFSQGVLYNGKKYIDIFNVSLKNEYIHNNKCITISYPISLRFPRRIRYFFNEQNNLNIYSDGSNIIISNDILENNKKYLTDIYEEKTLTTQKIKLEFSNILDVIASNITPNYTSIILKGKYQPLNNIVNFKILKGSIFKKIEVIEKPSVTEIKIYNSTLVKEPFISVDKVDNNIIIYASK